MEKLPSIHHVHIPPAFYIPLSFYPKIRYVMSRDVMAFTMHTKNQGHWSNGSAVRVVTHLFRRVVGASSCAAQWSVSITSDMSWPVKAAGSCVVGQLQATLPYLWWSLAKEGRVDHK